MDTNFKLYNYQQYFIVSLFEILKMSINKVDELGLTSKNYETFKKACNDLKQGFTDSEVKFDRGKIIKKVYKVITRNFDKIYPEQSLDLFNLRDTKGSIVTIIPGLNLKLIVDKFTKEELNTFWGHFCMLYVSSAEMINEINSDKKNQMVTEALPKLKEKIANLGVVVDGVIFNPYVGLLKDDEENYDISLMYKDIKDIEKPAGLKMSSILSVFGFDSSSLNKLASELREQLKNIDEDDIKNKVRELVGSDDPEVVEACSSLINTVLNAIGKNENAGMEDIVNSIQGALEETSSKLDKSKVAKTIGAFVKYLNDSENVLKNMKDKNGNPINQELLKSLELPLKIINKVTNGQNINQNEYKQMMKTASQQMQNMKNMMDKNKKM